MDRLRQARKLTADLRKPEALSETVRTLLDAQPGTDRLLIFVDQWEELYTQESAAQDQQDFIDQLLDATARAPLSVVMAVRGDFVGNVIGHRPLADRLQDAVVLAPPMNEDEFEEAIVGPARAAGLELDPGLAGRIREDVSSEPGSLPLLEFVLAQLWEKRRGARLSAEVYDAMGGVRGALAQHAEAVYAKLDRDEQAQLPRIFGRLVRPEDKSNLRRRARLSEFAPEEHPLLWKLADRRLLTTGRGTDGEKTIEVPHEALLERWPRLVRWIDSDREFLLWRQRTITRHRSADGTGEPIVLEAHSGGVRTASFSPDGGRIVTAGFDGMARVWSADGSREPVFVVHSGLVFCASFSPDGGRIVTAGDDGTARV